MNDRALKIYLFYCSNSLDENELSQCREALKGHQLKVISLPCSGKVNVPYLVKSFETGADGILIVTCELDQCRHLEGNMRAERRAEAVDSLLEEIGAGTGRIAAIHVKVGKIEHTVGKIREFCDRIYPTKTASATQER